jgi:hypothetical protein
MSITETASPQHKPQVAEQALNWSGLPVCVRPTVFLEGFF